MDSGTYMTEGVAPAEPAMRDAERSADLMAAEHITIIEPAKGWQLINFRELWRYRELLYSLTWRDVKVRYKQTLLGAAWAILQPVMMMVIFTIFFGRLAKLPAGNLPYPIFVFAGLLPWTFFASAIANSGNSVVGSERLITKIYFPRLFVPTAAVGGALFDMGISLVVFAITMAVFRVSPDWTIVFFPLLVLQTAMLGAGLAYLLSALTVTYRDFRFIIPFLAQIWMWLSFVMIPVPENWLHQGKWQYLFYVNPVYGIVSTYRRVLMGLEYGWNPWYLVSSIGITIGIFVLGLFYFRKTERRFADIA